MAEGANRGCQLCGAFNDDDHYQHNDGIKHRLNFMLHFRETKRKELLNYDGIFINQRIDLNIINDMQAYYQYKDGVESGTYITTLTSHKFRSLGGRLPYAFTIKNQRKEQMFVKIEKLYPLESYSISYDVNNNERSVADILNEGEQLEFKVTFRPNNIMIGMNMLPIGIIIQPIKNPLAEKIVYRDLEILIKDEADNEEDIRPSPFKRQHWGLDVKTYVEPTNSPKHLEDYPIPEQFVRVYMHGFKTFEGESGIEQHYRIEHLDMWQQDPTQENYQKFFHSLLWLEECNQTMGLLQYNMSQVTVQIMRKCVILEVPGLAEKRPSVLKGDKVILRLDHTAYYGVVGSVEDQSVHIEYLDEIFMMILQQNPNLELDVRFVLSRLQLERMHRGVDNSVGNGMLNSLFPVRPLNRIPKSSLSYDDLFNKTIATNTQQLIAVESILSGTSQRAPYIIYGPPGTGKTVTLVEAILQVKQRYPSRHILVCAPSNAACDMLATKLDQYCPNNELLRIHSGNRNINDIPAVVKYFSNLEGEDFYLVKPSDLKNYKIVISTLHLIGKFAGDYSPDMVFIDEVAQSTEPECDIPIGLLSPYKQIVLAGDPKQLGPVCGKLAGDYGLAKSLMDRLMETNELYQPLRRSPLIYNNDYITMLIHNYRSHGDIIKIPNELFYENTLEFDTHNDPISYISVGRLVSPVQNGKKKTGQGGSVEFIGVMSKEQRNGNSPSYYNDIEIEYVVKLIERMMDLSNIRIVPKDIGVIAPYIRQVVKIRNKLDSKGWGDIQVGTTEAFQGGERRIMIISTVRAQSDLLRYDRKYDLGFVKHERRFNVAITRAQAKLIIVGNPYVLGYDEKCWGRMISHCMDLNTYFGVEYKPRTEEIRQGIFGQITNGNDDRV